MASGKSGNRESGSIELRRGEPVRPGQHATGAGRRMTESSQGLMRPVGRDGRGRAGLPGLL